MAYGARDSDTTIAEFLAEDAGSIVGNGDLEMGPSGLTLTGYTISPKARIRFLSLRMTASRCA